MMRGIIRVTSNPYPGMSTYFIPDTVLPALARSILSVFLGTPRHTSLPKRTSLLS